MRSALAIAAAGVLLAAAPASAAWTPGPVDVAAVAEIDVVHGVAVDAAGNGLAVWDAPAGGRSAIRARRYDATGIWESPVREVSLAGSHNRAPRVAMDAAGNAFALWQGLDGEHRTIHARRFDAATGAWESETTMLSRAGEGAFEPNLAVEADGDAVAVWRGDDVIRARRYDAAAGAWETTTAALSTDAGGAKRPAVAVDDTGAATVAWDIDGTIEVKRYDPLKERWPAAATRLSPDGSIASTPRVGVDANGRVHAIWSAQDGGATFVEGRRFDGAWSPPELHSPRGGVAYAPELAVSRAGQATIAWFSQQDGKFVARARRWEATRWDPATTLSTPGSHAFPVKVAADDSGGALVAWRRIAIPSVIEVRRFDLASGWAAAVGLSGATSAEKPELGVGPRGDALALWQRPSGGSVTLQARRFVAPPPAPKPIPPVPSDLDTPELAASPVASVPDAPEITRLRMRGMRVELRLSAPAQLRAVLERRAGEHWKRVQTRRLSAKAGTVRFGFDRRRARLSGRYRVSVSLGALTRRATFRVR